MGEMGESMNTSNLISFLIALGAFLFIFALVAKLCSLSVATSAIVAAVATVFLFLVGAGCVKGNWIAVAAVAAILNIIWAVWHQEIRNYVMQPVFEMRLFESTSPYLLERKDHVLEANGKFESYKGLFIDFELTNKGKRTANRTQVHLTKVGHKGGDGCWNREKKWMAIPLKWVIPLSTRDLERELARDLVPNVPFYFSLGSFSKDKRIGKLLLKYYLSPKHQTETFPPGEHCFEITVFDEDADKVPPKYIYVTFEDFSKVTKLEEVGNYVKKIEIMDSAPPW